jgi:3-mercaptopyruvate sulfurtransferase SseA
MVREPLKTASQLLALVVAGAALSLAALAAGGRLRAADAGQLLLALEAQAPVEAWEVADAYHREGLLVLDGRSREEHVAARPAGSVHVPFADRHRGVFLLPEGRQVDAVLVIAARPSEARELAQWVFREWGVREVATLRGGFEAWRHGGSGFPVEEGEP